MKKLIASAVVAAAMALPAVPAAPAAASEIPPPAGTKPCPAPYTGGYIVWVLIPGVGYHEEWACIPGGPGVATTEDGAARAGVGNCQDRQAGYRGVSCGGTTSRTTTTRGRPAST